MRPSRVLLFAAIWITSVSLFAVEPPSQPKYGVRLENTWIPMKDGVRLAATLYRPDGTKPGDKFPALLEYLPYRKDDGTAARDYPLHAYFAHRGYVSVRVDIRGFGASEGVPTDREYSAQEQKDGLEVIHWLATQPWSNGNVGMFGISWGGFNSLQMAMQNPPELKAIIAIDATEELFHDDVHYMDGMAHIDEFELDMDLSQGFAAAPDYAWRERFGAAVRFAPVVADVSEAPARRAVLAQSGSSTGSDSRSLLPYRRTARRLPRQYSSHAGAGEVRASQGAYRTVEPHLSQ